MRILHLIDPSTPEDTLATVALITRQSGDTGHKVLAFGHKSVYAAAVTAGVLESVLAFQRSAGPWDPSGWAGVHQYFKSVEPTHLHCWGYWGMVACSLPKRLPAARIMTLTVEPSAIEIKLIKMASRRSRWHVITMSRGISDQLRRYGVAGDQLLHIPPGLPTPQRLDATASSLRDLLGIRPQDGPLLILGGTPSIHNRQDYGLWGTAILQQLYPRVQALVLLGQIRHRAAQDAMGHLTAFVQDLSNPDMIHLIEPNVTMTDILAAADIFLFTPDHDIDATPMLMAMAAGLPVVTTAVPCVLEIVHENAIAMVVPTEKPWQIAAAVNTLMTTPDLSKEITKNGRATVQENFSSDILNARFASVYNQLSVSDRHPLDALV